MFTLLNIKTVVGLATIASLVLSLPQTTTQPTTTAQHIPNGACVVGEKIYHDGESIHRDPEMCYFSWCSGGVVAHGDDRCFLYGQPHCDGQLVDIPGQCCHECREYTTTTTSTTTSTMSVSPGACIVDGHVYMNGATISGDSEHCAGSYCMGGHVVFVDDRCFLSGQPRCPDGHLVDIPGQCCHECIEDITTVPPSAIVG